MGPLGEIFNPGMRHEIEERRSKALRREEDGNARDADLRIDLESGFVNIVAPASDDEPTGETPKARPRGKHTPVGSRRTRRS